MRTIRYTPLILIMALLINAVLPFFALYPSNQHAEIALDSSAFGNKILLCTGEGFKWIKLADLQSGKEKPKPHSGNQCPLCYAARHGLKDMLPSVAINTLPSDRALNPPMPAYEPPFVIFLQTTPLNARAPPSSFIG